MKKALLLTITILVYKTSLLCQSNHLSLMASDTTITPLYAKLNLFRQDTIRVKLHVDSAASSEFVNVVFILDASGFKTAKPVLFPGYDTVKISKSRWNSARASTNQIDTFILIQTSATTDTLKHDEIARVFIKNRPELFVQIRFTSVLPPPKGQIFLKESKTPVYIHPFTDNSSAPQVDSVKIRLEFVGDFDPRNDIAHVYIDTPALPNDLKVINPLIHISKMAWDTGYLDAFIYISSNSVFDTGALKSGSCSLKIREDSIDAIPIWMTYKGYTWYKKSNFFIGSFIKSISGTTAQNELLDIFLKINILPKKQLDSGHLWFCLLGADAGLSSDTVGKRGLPLNEAIVNVNWSPTFLFGKIDNETKRIGFIGAGLKVFYTNAYFGGHIGITEISSFLKGSYLLAGFYHSPWMSRVRDSSKTDTARLPYTYFRNNLYFEAAFNAFGDNAPKALQFIRLKFGLMLPIKSKDFISPTNKDFIYRLAVEVPIGGALKF